MVPLTRRRLLGGTAALLTGLAGCSESLSSQSTATGHAPREANTGDVPDHYALRNSTDEPPVRIPRADRRGTTEAATSTSGPPENARQGGLVASAETAEKLWFADVDGASEARRFVTDTDFDSETIYVDPQSVRECHSLELCSVSWSDSDIHTQYGSYYRDADVSCRVEARDGVSWLIRIPDVLHPDSLNSRGSGWSSSGCRRGRRPDETGTTEAPEFGPKSPTNATESTSEGDR